MRRLTIDEILDGTVLGDTQSVGAMQVVPLLGEDRPEFAPPEVEVDTTTYGTVRMRNPANRPTIVPTAAGWVVARSAQDHAIGGATLLEPKQMRTVDTAMCIQQTQGGLLNRQAHPMVILPAALRTPALAKRKEVSYGKLWGEIEAFNRRLGAPGRGGHLVHFLRHFARELDQFVAEFEVVPDQIGALVIIDGAVVGVERAPSAAYWKVVWTPLIRICYGSLAVAIERPTGALATRHPLRVLGTNLDSIADALHVAEEIERRATRDLVAETRASVLAVSKRDDKLGNARLHTVSGSQLSGQVLRRGRDGDMLYASLCAA